MCDFGACALIRSNTVKNSYLYILIITVKKCLSEHHFACDVLFGLNTV